MIRPTPSLGEAQIATEFESRLAEADDLSDRRTTEALRVTELDAANRRMTEANAIIETRSASRTRWQEQLEDTNAGWSAAWPGLSGRTLELTVAKAIAEERQTVIARSSEADAVDAEYLELRDRFESCLELLTRTEKDLNLEMSEGNDLASRVGRAKRALLEHEKSHAEYRVDEQAIADKQFATDRKRQSLAALQFEKSKWDTEWREALRAIGLNEVVPPQRGTQIATQWATAEGVLGQINQTQKRLQRMDEDEQALAGLILIAASEIGTLLPDDAIEAARVLSAMLGDASSIVIQRESLAPELEKQTLLRTQKQQVEKDSIAAIGLFCTQASTTREQLESVASKCREMWKLLDERGSALESIRSAGDEQSIDALREQWAGQSLDAVTAQLQQANDETGSLDEQIEAALEAAQLSKQELEKHSSEGSVNPAVAARERAAADIRKTVERYVELIHARTLLERAIDKIRAEQQDPLVLRAGELFSVSTRGEFVAVETDVDSEGEPIVVGKRATGETVSLREMSDGTRDQLFLAFRLASVEHYCNSAEPLPFICDDVLVHFDDERSVATIDCLAELAQKTQVILFTHHRSVREAVRPLEQRGLATLIDVSPN